MKVIKFNKVILLVLGVIFLLTGCAQNIKEDKVYLLDNSDNQALSGNIYTTINSKGSVPFKDECYQYKGNDLYDVVVTVSPDNKYAVLMERLINLDSISIIKGETNEFVKLYKVETSSGKKTLISNNTTFISNAKWNKDGKIVSLWGDGKLLIYNIQSEQKILEENLQNQNIIYCGWSPDGKKLYTEHNALSNDSICYVEDNKILSSYEIKENLFYKGKLDERYYYATKLIETPLGITSKTVISDSMGNIYEDFPQGRFRDSYKSSLLQIGEKGSGLYYSQDINSPEKFKTMSQEIIYDTKFVYGGRFVYIIKNNDIEKNNYRLLIADNKGEIISEMYISGSSILISPDGKYGYVGGPLEEKIDILNHKVESYEKSLVDEERDSIYNTLRGGIEAYYNKLSATSNDNLLSKYFINSHNPEQWALFETKNVLNQDTRKDLGIEKHVNDLKLSSINTYEVDGEKRTQVNVQESNTYEGKINVTTKMNIELIKRNSKWYITGFSTFPLSEEFREVTKEVKNYIKDIKNGILFSGELKGKDISIGQIQFWEGNATHFSNDITTADYCKIYLKVSNGNNILYYKLLLEKQSNQYWKPISLNNELLNNLK